MELHAPQSLKKWYMKSNAALPSSANLEFVESLYAQYLTNPDSAPPEWREFLKNLSEEESSEFRASPRLDPGFEPVGLFRNVGARGNSTATTSSSNVSASSRSPRPTQVVGSAEDQAIGFQDRVNQFIRAYRYSGHLAAQIDPLGLQRSAPPELDPKYYEFTETDMERKVSCETVSGGGALSLGVLMTKLRSTYCRRIGVEYMHIDDVAVRRWLQARMEGCENRLALSKEEQLRIFTRLTDAATFEEFIHKKYIGAKSFSLEGSESLIPLLDLAIEKAGDQGIKEIVLGMAHRGRLNVLANIMGKCPREIFREFEDLDPEFYRGAGDVKYHLGYSGNWTTKSGNPVHLSLCFNPSHLEFVNPVVLGRTRAKQDRVEDVRRGSVLSLIIHGDAAFAGEGMAQEIFNISQLPAYTVGGALHIIVNNQIGFTTPPEQGRSVRYATDVAKMLQIPIFHVNGEDPEAVAQVVRLAMDFRAEFKRDVVIDMYSYRLWGHNESDEPAFTQPLLYRAIQERKSVRESYMERLLKLNEITRTEAEEIEMARRDKLETHLSEARSKEYNRPVEKVQGIWSRSSLVGGQDQQTPDVETGYDRDFLAQTMNQLAQVPDGFQPHPKIKRWLKNRSEMALGEKALDWAAAEALAFATLAAEGARVRLTGQDCERGTFSHRHSVLHDYNNGKIFSPIKSLSSNKAPIEIYNSALSETAVLGFDYGYSLDYPDGLTLWEAQFGDFVNVAQVIIDQFISSAEDKWNRLSNLTMLLPHGFEGMGPEHSSARLERFLTLAAEDNIQVVNPTTPAQYFHLLRRQVRRSLRKPLVVMSPKSLLRHPKVISSLDELAEGQFQRILPDELGLTGSSVRRVALCSGKVYYDLTLRREETEQRDVAILRLEQYYPLSEKELAKFLEPYSPSTPVVWVQEEPRNMGAWRYLRGVFGDHILGRKFTGVTRPESASPATGSASSHQHEQRELLDAAFAP